MKELTRFKQATIICLKACALTFLYVITFLFLASLAHAEIDVNRLADAIGKAENSKAHPYGIMQKYKHTSPRQACVNTIRHALRDWNGKGDFIAFLAERYAPTKNSTNDPKGLNKNWYKNVSYFYAKGGKI